MCDPLVVRTAPGGLARACAGPDTSTGRSFPFWLATCTCRRIVAPIVAIVRSHCACCSSRLCCCRRRRCGQKSDLCVRENSPAKPDRPSSKPMKNRTSNLPPHQDVILVRFDRVVHVRFPARLVWIEGGRLLLLLRIVLLGRLLVVFATKKSLFLRKPSCQSWFLLHCLGDDDNRMIDRK
jgi:hypothetical protein